MNLADKLDLLMKQHNIKNPKELSQKLNQQNLKIPYTTLLTIINNEVQDIKLGTAQKLCNYFNITLDELLDDDVPINKEDNNETFRYASYNGEDVKEDLTEEEIEELMQYKEFIKQKRKK